MTRFKRVSNFLRTIWDSRLLAQNICSSKTKLASSVFLTRYQLQDKYNLFPLDLTMVSHDRTVPYRDGMTEIKTRSCLLLRSLYIVRVFHRGMSLLYLRLKLKKSKPENVNQDQELSTTNPQLFALECSVFLIDT